MNKLNLLRILLVVFIYALATGASYKVLSSVAVPGVSSPIAAPTVGPEGKISFDQTLPKTESCPLNGAKYSKQQRQWWEKHEPLGIMIENHVDARPQSGLSSADVVYEAVAEGGITRFLGVYHCQNAEEVGPVRSARTYFVNFLSEYGGFPLYGHVGGANSPGPANALGQIVDYGWAGYNDLSEFAIGCPVYCRLESHNGKDVATEHTVYSSTQKLWDYAKNKRGISNVNKEGESWDEDFTQWMFKDDQPSKSSSQKVHVEFWPSMGSQFFDDWTYDPISNSYKRSLGNAPHIDRNNKKQIMAKNVVVLYMTESNANDGYENNIHLLYKDKGKGKADVFMDGKQIKGTWEKSKRTDRTIIKDNTGIEVKFNRGQIWLQIVPTQEGVVKVQ